MFKFIKYNPKNASNCILRTFSKITNKDPLDIEKEFKNLSIIMNHNDYSYIEVFEKYLENINFIKINTDNNILIKDLILDNDTYCIFCWDKNSYYHIVPIINNTIYDKSDEVFNLYPITIYKLIK